MKRSKRPRPDGWIYFVTCDWPDFPVKIGFATDIDSRMKGHQTSLPYEVVILGAMRGTMTGELMMRNRWKKLRLRGEWFRRDPDLMAYIRDRARQWPEPEEIVDLSRTNLDPRDALRLGLA